MRSRRTPAVLERNTQRQELILIVEDDPDVGSLLLTALQLETPYDTRLVSDGEAALRLITAQKPHLVISDYRLPGMNGLDATQRIREHQALRQTPIVAVSAYGADEYRAIALKAGCNEYVSTPFEPRALAELIKTLLATS